MNSYEWYPGHMTAAIRMMRENLSLIDLVIEVVDARIPASSRNPDIDGLSAGKARLLVFCKADLSDRRALKVWEEKYRGDGFVTVTVNAKEAGAKRAVLSAVDAAAGGRRERNERRGLQNRAIRALVAGIPNVGKSTIINLLAGRSAAKTGNRPGVTKGKQWIQTGKTLQLLDSPGILWPKIGDADAGELLALIGSMNDDNLDGTLLAEALIRRLQKLYPQAVAARYQLADEAEGGVDAAPEVVLEAIARRRGCLGEGGRLMTGRAAQLLLDDFRKGKLGGMLLERPADQGE